MEVSDARRLHSLEDENRLLKQIVTDLKGNSGGRARVASGTAAMSKGSCCAFWLDSWTGSTALRAPCGRDRQRR